MIIFALSLSIISLFFISFALVISYHQEFKKVNTLTETLKKIKGYLDISQRINVDSRGYFKYKYLDTALNIENVLNIPFEVERFSLKHDKVLVKFLFKDFFSENDRKGINIMFDDFTIKLLKMFESQWHDVNSENIIWEDITLKQKDLFFEEQELVNTPIVETIELTLYEKQDINGFLKFSTISEETKTNIKKILNL
jgi:hypothetical protein